MRTHVVLSREDLRLLIAGGHVDRAGAVIYMGGNLQLDDLIADVEVELAKRARIAGRLEEISRGMDRAT